MQLNENWIYVPETQALFQGLEAAGHEALFVGGCVRNALLGAPASDVDIATSARPELVTQVGEALGLRVHPTGIDHGTVTVSFGGTALEVTTFRKDVATDGRRAVVAFADTVEDDALRRDFTMNALYARPDGSVVDPLGGQDDLHARHVRFIEDPTRRIQEDFLRILRFFRFHAHYGDQAKGLDPEGLAACAAQSAGLETLSKERVGAEMLKLLSAPDPAPAVCAMEHTGCLWRILPGADSSSLAPLVHLEGDLRVNPFRRLATMGLKRAKDALRLSTAQAQELQAIQAGAYSSKNPAELAYRVRERIARDVVLVRCALLGEALPKGLDKKLEKGARAKFPVSAAHLPDLAGPALGEKLRALEAAWIASGFKLSKSELLK